MKGQTNSTSVCRASKTAMKLPLQPNAAQDGCGA